MSCCGKKSERFVKTPMGFNTHDGLAYIPGMKGMEIPSGMVENYCGGCSRMIPDVSVLGYIPDLSIKPGTTNQALPSGLSPQEYSVNRGMQMEYYDQKKNVCGDSPVPADSSVKVEKYAPNVVSTFGYEAVNTCGIMPDAPKSMYNVGYGCNAAIENYCGSPGNLPGALPGLHLKQFNGIERFSPSYNPSQAVQYKVFPGAVSPSMYQSSTNNNLIYNNFYKNAEAAKAAKAAQAKPSYPPCPDHMHFNPSSIYANDKGCVKNTPGYKYVVPGIF
jgi:hypothetical protein